VSNPSNHISAGKQARALLAHTLPGSKRGTVQSHLQRAEYIGGAIWRRWQVGPRQWKLKHVRWYLTSCLKPFSVSTSYRHWLTMRAIVCALGQYDQWMPYLHGEWIRPTGDKQPLKTGRPAKLPNI